KMRAAAASSPADTEIRNATISVRRTTKVASRQTRKRGQMNRRDFIRASTAGLAAATNPAADGGRAAGNPVRQGQLGSLRSASPSDLQGLVGDGQQRRILLRGGVVLSLDPRVGDFEKADVLIDGKRIAEVAPTVSAGDAEIVDCSGTIVMPGFIATH